MKAVYLIIPIIFLLSCSVPQSDDTNETKHTHFKKYWVSTNYDSCLSQSLPCKCAIGGARKILMFNSDKPTKVESFVNNIDFGGYDIAVKSNDTFSVSLTSESLGLDSAWMFDFVITSDTLYLKSIDNEVYQFINYPQMDSLVNFSDFVSKYHLYKAEELFTNHGFVLRDNLTITDSTKLYCNNYLGDINLLSIPNGDNIILEEDSATLYIYKWLDPPQQKSVDVDITKELLYKIEK